MVNIPDGGTRSDGGSLSPESVGLWATQTIYFMKMKGVADVGGPIADKGFQQEVWRQARDQAEALWAQTRSQFPKESVTPIEFVMLFVGNVLAWGRTTG